MNYEVILDNSSAYCKAASQVAKQWNSEQQFCLHSSFSSTTAFPSQQL
jgi:hypothetical protein